MLAKRAEKPLDMCNGPVMTQMLRFAIPLVLSGILQLLYNAADLIVVGRFTGSHALAAVGATSSLVSMLTNVTMGLSVGANVTIARAVGARDDEDASTATHTSVMVGALCGLFIGIIGVIFAESFARLLDTPSDILSDATLYFRIIAIGLPATLLYNFGAAVLRSIGDTKRPLLFLSVSGAVNVVLNLFFVIVCRMGVSGVAIATVISQYLSAVLVVRTLSRLDGPCRLSLNDLKINRTDLRHILKIGVPSGIQSCCFSIANILIQSSVNSFGASVIAGNTAACNLECFIHTPMDAISQSVLTFSGQNIGAKKYRRMPKILKSGLALITVIAGMMGALFIIFRTPLLSIYIKNDAEALAAGSLRMLFIASSYYTCGWMHCFSQSLRAMGHSTLPMFTCVGFVCGLRLVIIFTLFRSFHRLEALFICYPASWIMVVIVLFFAFRHFYKKLLKKETLQLETV